MFVLVSSKALGEYFVSPGPLTLLACHLWWPRRSYLISSLQTRIDLGGWEARQLQYSRDILLYMGWQFTSDWWRPCLVNCWQSQRRLTCVSAWFITSMTNPMEVSHNTVTCVLKGYYDTKSSRPSCKSRESPKLMYDDDRCLCIACWLKTLPWRAWRFKISRVANFFGTECVRGIGKFL